MIGAEWFHANGRWHAFSRWEQARTMAGAVTTLTEARCGLVLATEAELVTSTEEQPVPPDACAPCLHFLAFDDVVEEPIEDAKARGYEPYDPSQDDSASASSVES